MSLINEHLLSLQASYCLQSCIHQGGLLWIRDWELRLGIIVGQDDYGTMWMVVDQPSKMHYHIQPLTSLHSSDYYIDFDNPKINKEATALLAFDLLTKYNTFNGQKYDSFHKVVLPKNILDASKRADWKTAVKNQMNVFGQVVLDNSIGRLYGLNQRLQQLMAGQVAVVKSVSVAPKSKSIELNTNSEENIHRQIA